MLYVLTCEGCANFVHKGNQKVQPRFEPGMELSKSFHNQNISLPNDPDGLLDANASSTKGDQSP